MGNRCWSNKEELTPTQSSATGTLTIIDPDAGEASFNAQTNTAGSYGSFSITSDGAWVYNIDNSLPAVQQLKEGESKTEIFTVTSLDGTSTSVTITVSGTNDAPTATADTASVARGRDPYPYACAIIGQ
ncbi:VCBS domain-containing protein [Alishewanella longhuensis]